MPSKRWTIIIIPPENGAAQTFSVSRRTRRIAVGMAAGFALLIVTAFGILFTPYARQARDGSRRKTSDSAAN
jgi:hypothetical protein